MIKSPSLGDSKLLFAEYNSSNMFYILNELAFNGESSSNEVRQRIWDWESKHNDYYPCLHFEFRSGGKSSSPPYELSFGGDELWTISDEILA